MPIIDKVREENPNAQVGNFNSDNGYQNADNSEGLETRGIENNIAQRKTGSRKIPKKRQNQRKCIKGIFGILTQCLGLERTWVHDLPNVFKDMYLNFIALFFQAIVSFELGIEDMYLKPTYFFG